MHPFFLHELKQAGNVHRFRNKKWLTHHFRDTAIFFALTEGAEKILDQDDPLNVIGRFRVDRDS